MNKGTSQKSRKNIALNPESISIDERSMLDLVQFTLNFSQNLNFYNFHNKVVDNWKSFLLNDSAFILASVATADTGKFKKDFNELNSGPDDADIKEQIKNATSQIYSQISNWAAMLKRSNYEGILLNEMEKLIQSATQKTSIQNSSNEIQVLKETYDNIFGNLVFIREKAAKHFEEELFKSSHHPHIGLLLAFFKLFKNLQFDINTITKKHLDYYYLDILQQKRKELKSHSAIIALHLQPGIEKLEINEGDIFNFGFEEEQQIDFKASSNTQINKAEIAEIKTLFKRDYYPFGNRMNDEDFSIDILYENEILLTQISRLNSGLKQDEDFPATLGEEKPNHLLTEGSVKLSDVGFLISSPSLILEKGQQTIHLTFKITPDSYNESKSLFDNLLYQEIEHQNNSSSDKEKLRKRVVSKFFDDSFSIFITDKEGWKQIENSKPRINSANYTLSVDIQINEQTDVLVPFNNEIHEGNYKTNWPCIRLILNNDAQYHPYKILKNIIIEEINIEATVLDVSNLTLSNSAGNLDTSIPFTPFGPVPVVGSFLRIQNQLILQNNLSSLEININWLGLPQLRNGFANYFRAYPKPPENAEFKALVAQNKNNLSAAESQNQQVIELFETKSDYLLNEKGILVNLENFKFKNQAHLSTNGLDENATSLYIVLKSPDFAFGHQVFSEIYAKAALKMSRFRKKNIDLPNQPFTPVIERLSVNYTNTSREIMLRKQEDSTSDIKLIHIYPFGHVQVFPGPVRNRNFLLPQINHKGNLYIGLKQINAGNMVSIGFELAPAVYEHTVINIPKVKWQYLLNNEWQPLDGLVLEDGTLGLIRSGVIKIRIPESVQFHNTRLPEGKFWIRAVYDGKETLNSRIKNVFTQAVAVTSSGKVDNWLFNTRNAPIIKKIGFETKKGILEIAGPVALKLNKLTENEDSFYSRISEQLRHKNRVVTNWDVERIILDRFNQIEKVRVYGRNSHPKELVHGSNMQIVLIPKISLSKGEKLQSTKIDISTLLEVKEYISQFVSPYLNIEVSNPVYEQLKVRCCVKFNDIHKSGYFKDLLNNELIRFLSPGIETEFIEKGFDESFSKSEILNFIESRPYVHFVTEFSVLQLVEVQGNYKIIDTAKIQKINELRTISSYAILTSAPEHQIDFVENEKSLLPKISGIGDLSIEADFVISDNSGNYY
jgi:hypothetical protein